MPQAPAEAPMTDREVMDALRSDTPLNRARAAFSAASARIEQADAQARPCGPIETRRMEFEAVIRIAAALGIAVDGTGVAGKAAPAGEKAATETAAVKHVPNAAQLALLGSYPDIDVLGLPDDPQEVDAAVNTPGRVGDTLFKFAWIELGEVDDPRDALLRAIDDLQAVVDALPEDDDEG